jgi:hypothetical protein
MSIITKKQEINNKLTTLLTIKGIGDLIELFEYNLPYPHEYKRYGDKWEISWYVDGVFWTKQGIDYINDILSRFLVSFEKITYSTAHPINVKDNALKLKLFKQLNSIKKNNFTSMSNKYEDSVFWSLKLFVEHYLTESDFVPYSTLENFAMNHFVDYVKDKSTLKAKCRSVWNWYSERDWKKTERIFEKTKEEYKLTRTENMKKIAIEKTDKNYKKVVSVITGLYKNEYKKPNGKWNIMKISKDTNLTRPTVSKYIKQFENQKG